MTALAFLVGALVGVVAGVIGTLLWALRAEFRETQQ